MFWILFLSLFLRAQTPPPVTHGMVKVAQNMQDLLPYLSDPSKFNDEDHQKEIASKISQIKTLFQENKTHFAHDNVAQVINLELMVDVLTQAEKAFKVQNKEYARQLLKATPGLCISCHSQDHLSQRFFPTPDSKKFLSLREAAEFHLITRQYESAGALFEKLIEQKNKLSDEKNLASMRLALATYLRAEKPYEKMMEKINLWKKLYPIEIYQKSLEGWAEGIKKLSSLPEPEMKFSSIKAWMVKLLGQNENTYGVLAEPQVELIYFKLKDLLYSYLTTKATNKEVPEILFYLAVSEKSLNYTFFYSLADGYLQACIKNYPRTPFARKCFEEYKNFIEFSYTGSGGSDIPPDVKKDLETLKNLIK
jgi:hypothetical protein